MRTVLVDLTAWQTPHRLRGIGRFVRDLAAGLGAVGAGRDGPVRALGLTRIDALGRPTIIDDLSALRDLVADDALEANDARVLWGRRVHLSRIARHVGAFAVHLPDPMGTPVGSIARIVTCHDLIPLRFADRYLGWKDGFAPFRRARELRRFGGAARVIAISDETRRDLVTLLDVDPARISVVHNGIDLTRWSAEPGPDDAAVAARHGLAPHGYLLYVGGLEWRKNADGMLSAIAAVRDVPLVRAWAGKLTDSEVATRRAAAARLGVGDRLRLLGFVDDTDLAALHRCALAHVLVSFAEGFGLTLVEAMACGAPVIATAGSSRAEGAGDAALLVDPADPQAIAAAARRLAGDRGLRVDLRTRGVERAQRFSHLAFARRTLEAYARAQR
ncbi:MAG: hypothetical protein NVS3B10_06670 [Polyangiales bacterium]